MQKRLSSILASQGFTLALIGAVLAAIVYPDLGLKGGPLHTELTTKVAVALTFLIQGLSLPTRQIAASAAKLKLHFFSQAMIFVAAPVLMWGMLLIVGSALHPDIYPGFIYLAVLPTTISSAIVMTSSSGGDSSTALFSTTLSNVLGIFVTPALCTFLLAAEADSGPSLISLIAKLSTLVLLPLVVGQLIRPFVREWAKRSKKLFKRLSNGFIVFIVYAAFCQSVASGVWSEVGASSVVVTLAFVLFFLLSFSYIVWLSSSLLTKEVEQRIAVFFCASQKTLASGVPMASIIFATTNGAESSISTGLVILPLMCYHPLQLFLAGFLSPRFSRLTQA